MPLGLGLPLRRLGPVRRVAWDQVPFDCRLQRIPKDRVDVEHGPRRQSVPPGMVSPASPEQLGLEGLQGSRVKELEPHPAEPGQDMQPQVPPA